MTPKYELTSQTKKIGDLTLYRICALKNFGDVKKGEFGGFVESESNLSQKNNAWVSGNAWVCGMNIFVADFLSNLEKKLKSG